jgi:hypothetical protein
MRSTAKRYVHCVVSHSCSLELTQCIHNIAHADTCFASGLRLCIVTYGKSSSQGRLDDNFGDDNSEVVQAAMKQFPTLGTLEVVTLLHRTDSTLYIQLSLLVLPPSALLQ